VHGEVHRPGLYLVDLTMTLRDIIAQAGGITPAGDPNRISVVRDGERLQFSRGRGSEFVAAELVSGDQVAVGPRSWFERNSLAVISTAAVVVSILIPIIQSMVK
jgi:polysaccharide export outer membrane protein